METIKDKLNSVLKNVAIRTREGLPETGQDLKTFVLDRGQLIIYLIAYLVMNTLLALIVFNIMAAGGLAGVFASLMAAACTNSGAIPCDFNLLLGSIGLALVILTGAAVAIWREIVKIEKIPFDVTADLKDEPYLFYNEDMLDALNTIRGLKGVENLHSLANYKGIPYSTLRRWVEKYEADGYVKIENNGKGKPVEVYLTK